MRAVWAAAFLLRRLRTERGVVLLLALVVGLTSFLGAAAPRVYDLVAGQVARESIAAATVARRNVEFVQELAISPNEDPVDVLDRLGTTYVQMLGPTLEGLVTAREVVATSPRLALRNPPRYTTFVSLRHQTGIDGELRLVDGRWPASTGDRLPLAVRERDTPGEPPDVPPRVEIVVSQQTATEAGIEVGQVLDGSVDSNDPLLQEPLLRPLGARLEVVGIFAVEDPGAPIWYSENSLQRPGADYNSDSPVLFVTALIAPDAYPDVAASNVEFRYAWHSYLDVARIDTSNLGAIVEELRRAESTFATSSLASAGPERVVFRSGLLEILQTHTRQVAASEAVLSIAAIGPLALAAAAVGMLAVLLIARRRPSLVLARGRGASARLLLGAQAWEAAILAGTASLAGLSLALVLVPSRSSGPSIVLAVASALATVVLLAAATWVAVRRPLEPSARDETRPVRVAPRRLVLEATAVLLAVAGVGLLQQRGLTIDAAREPVRFDPFLAAVPVLTGFAAGLVATRLYPLPIRALGWLAARRRDLVPVLGLRNVGRRPSFTTVPLLVLMLTAAFGSFALVITSSIDRGQRESSWHEVGADYRIEAPPGASLAGIDREAIAGAEALAAAYVNPNTQFRSGPSIGRVQLTALDPASYDAVAAGTPSTVAWPAEFRSTPGATIGTPADPIPMIISPQLQFGTEGLSVGENARLRVTGGDYRAVRVIDVRDVMPGYGPSDRFVVLPLAHLAAAYPPVGGVNTVEPNLLLLRGPESIEADLAALVAAEAPNGSTFVSRHAWYAGLRGAPLNAVVSNGFRLGLVVAVAYALFAVVTALTLTAARRTQDTAFLRTLGMSSRQAAGVTLVEHGIPVLIALGPGVAVGVAVALLLESSLGLGAFISEGTAYRTELDWSGIAAMAGLLAIVVTAAVVVSTWLSRRTSVVEALRVGEA